MHEEIKLIIKFKHAIKYGIVYMKRKTHTSFTKLILTLLKLETILIFNLKNSGVLLINTHNMPSHYFFNIFVI